MPLFSIHTSLCLFTVKLGIIVDSVYPNYRHLPFAISRINFAISSGCNTYDAWLALIEIVVALIIVTYCTSNNKNKRLTIFYSCTIRIRKILTKIDKNDHLTCIIHKLIYCSISIQFEDKWIITKCQQIKIK